MELTETAIRDALIDCYGEPLDEEIVVQVVNYMLQSGFVDATVPHHEITLVATHLYGFVDGDWRE